MADSLGRADEHDTRIRMGQPIFFTAAAKCPDDDMDASCTNSDGSMMYGVLGCTQSTVSTSGAGKMNEGYTYEECLDYCTQESIADSGSYQPYMTYRKYYEDRLPGDNDPTPCHCWSGSKRYFRQICTHIVVSSEGAKAGIENYNTCLGDVKAEVIPPLGGGGTGDPHLHFAHGGRADFRGVHGRYFSFLSLPGLAVNAKTEESLFRLNKGRLTVNGSFITEAPPPPPPTPHPLHRI